MVGRGTPASRWRSGCLPASEVSRLLGGRGSYGGPSSEGVALGIRALIAVGHTNKPGTDSIPLVVARTPQVLDDSAQHICADALGNCLWDIALNCRRDGGVA